ncbi:hypothetical protein LQW54_011267 [Pestalotiopsis sp. IQ-011]
MTAQTSPHLSCLVEAGLQDLVLTSADGGYTAREAAYWSRSAALKPACIVRPKNAKEVSAALNAIVQGNKNFAVRSGGHAPSVGVSNISEGITIDLGLINHIIYDAASETVTIGPGQKWKEVYKELQKFNRTVAGSRDGNVGVGGFLLGGGYSWITACKGWSCDNVLEYEVVLADGRIVTSSAEKEPELFRALKGGGNNFGICTNFTMSTIPCEQVFGGKAIAPKSSIPDVIRIATNFPETVTKYPNSNIVIVITYVPERDDIVASGALVQLQSSSGEPDHGLDEWMALPKVLDTTKMTTIYDLTFEIMLPHNYHNTWFTGCFKNDERIIAKAVEVHNDVVEQLRELIPERDFRTQCIIQPVPKMISEHSAAAGGNVMGVERHATNGFLLLLSAMVKTSEQQAMVFPKIKAALQAVKDYAEVTVDGGNLSWIYMNYADKSQQVLEGYGPDNVANLQKVAAKYDPEKVFQTLCPGGWKIPEIGA